MFRLVSWNVAHRTAVQQQAEALARRKPDVVALQEIVTGTSAPWQRLLSDFAGLEYAISSLGAPGCAKTGPRRFGELIVGRWKIEPLPFCDLREGWPERLLSGVADTPWGAVEVHTAYIPPGASNKLVKIFTLEGIYSRLAVASSRPRILCGDFNTPQLERRSEIVTWAQLERVDGSFRIRRRMRGVTGNRWDSAERHVLERLGKEYDLADVYRVLHPEKSGDYSWYTRTGEGRRFDHVFASRSLNAVGCWYLHDLRISKLSDHSGIEADFQPNALGSA
jgi:exonuclease III